METGGTERQMRWEGEQKLEPLSPPAPARPRACTHASPACTRSARMRSEAQIDRFSRAWLGSPICTRGARLGWPCRQPNTKGLHPWMRASELLKNQLQFSIQIALTNLVQIFDNSSVSRMVRQECLLVNYFSSRNFACECDFLPHYTSTQIHYSNQ
uniref:Uncharacterized protein n=1 Tax=Oryza barthii TaxID=65489 RepID=A0A0D3FD35_9ORYZ